MPEHPCFKDWRKNTNFSSQKVKKTYNQSFWTIMEMKNINKPSPHPCFKDWRNNPKLVARQIKSKYESSN